MYTTSTVLALAALAVSAAAQSAQTTISAMLGNKASLGVAASVVGANACATTLAVQCTNTDVCTGTLNPTITLTQGPLFYSAAFATSLAQGQGSFSEYCTLQGPLNSATQASCHYYISLSAPGTSSTTSLSSTLSASQISYVALPITAGAEKLSSATGSCTSTAPPPMQTAAGGTSSSKAAAAAPTAVGLKEVVYKIVVPVAAGVIALV